MLEIMSTLEYHESIYELEEFLKKKTKELLSQGWRFYSTDKAPETFQRLRAHGKNIPVANYGLTNTIYTMTHSDYSARFWHDATHVILDKGFSIQDEYTVILEQCRQLSEEGVSVNAQKVFWIDMYYQSLHYEVNKTFVVNQQEFVLNHVRGTYVRHSSITDHKETRPV
jgi:hypothetical protein